MALLAPAPEVSPARPGATEVWAKMAEFDVPMFVHGAPLACEWQDPSQLDPFDTPRTSDSLPVR
jgi:hypothetical protein